MKCSIENNRDMGNMKDNVDVTLFLMKKLSKNSENIKQCIDSELLRNWQVLI